MKTIHYFLAILTLFILSSNEVQCAEYVSIDYPNDLFGLGEEDNKLPGTPSEDINEYKKEIRVWPYVRIVDILVINTLSSHIRFSIKSVA